MSDPVTRLNAALEGRYAIERELAVLGLPTAWINTYQAQSRTTRRYPANPSPVEPWAPSRARA